MLTDLCRLFAVAWDLGPRISIKRSVTVLKHLQWLCDGDIGVCVYVCMCVFVCVYLGVLGGSSELLIMQM